jgi:hypothetical protein
MAGYKPEQHGMIRDKTYPSEIAAQRPLAATRIYCQEPWDEEREMREATIRGDRGFRSYPEPEPVPGPHHGDITESRCEEFNRALRSGHGFRNEGDE